MSDRLGSKSELVAYLESGCRQPSAWRLGTEHEKFGFRKDSLAAPAYAGANGIRALLEGLAEAYAWEPVYENDLPIALKKEGCSITLEPGGQLELSGEQLDSVHETCAEVNQHLAQVKVVADPLGLAFLGMGFHPLLARDAIPWMPKGRYRIMADYMPKVGALGLDMMKRTCTVQVNLDFSSEADMVRKFRASLALQPVATALFANSPFVEGRPSGWLSYRARVWQNTDPNRTGTLPFVFDDGFGFEAYVDYMLEVPMYFVHRDGAYLDVAGASFRDFLAGRLEALPGERPTLTDWENHLTTAFPEVRLKRYLEMRGADGGPWHRLCALPALWAGLLYDASALDGAWDLCRDWNAGEREGLRRDVARRGLQAEIRGRSVRDLALEVLGLAEAGLAARRRLDAAGRDETRFLESLWRIAESGETPAERKLAAWHSRWNGDIRPLFAEYAY